MPFLKEKSRVDCLTLPETLVDIFEKPRFKVAQGFRDKVIRIVVEIDQSRGTGVTCIANEDQEKLAHLIDRGIASGNITDEWSFAFRDRLRGKIHDMNRNCVDCYRIECPSRSAGSMEDSEPGPISQRGAKLVTRLPYLEDDE